MGSLPGAFPAQLEVLLQVEALTKRFGPVTALHQVSFSVCRGEVLGLIGPNGSGKTTLFECLGRTLPVDEGRILIQGRQSSPLDQAQLLFYLPDAITPWPSQRVRWVLDFIVDFFGSAAEKCDEIVNRLGIEPFADVQIGRLSKGQRKRVLLALGLLTPHPLLLADEPFDGLDARQTREAVVTLRSAAAEGRTLLLSIHQLVDAARVCDRFVLLSGGRACGEGTYAELALRAGGQLGTPAADLEEVFLALT